MYLSFWKNEKKIRNRNPCFSLVISVLSLFFMVARCWPIKEAWFWEMTSVFVVRVRKCDDMNVGSCRWRTGAIFAASLGRKGQEKEESVWVQRKTLSYRLFEVPRYKRQDWETRWSLFHPGSPDTRVTSKQKMAQYKQWQRIQLLIECNRCWYSKNWNGYAESNLH